MSLNPGIAATQMHNSTRTTALVLIQPSSKSSRNQRSSTKNPDTSSPKKYHPGQQHLDRDPSRLAFPAPSPVQFGLNCLPRQSSGASCPGSAGYPPRSPPSPRLRAPPSASSSTRAILPQDDLQRPPKARPSARHPQSRPVCPVHTMLRLVPSSPGHSHARPVTDHDVGRHRSLE